MHQLYHPGFAKEVPYAVVMVELEEGCKFVSKPARRQAARDQMRDAGKVTCAKNSAMKSRCRNSGSCRE